MQKSELYAIADRIERLTDSCNDNEHYNIEFKIDQHLGWPRGYSMSPQLYLTDFNIVLRLALAHGFIARMGCIAADGLPGCTITISTDPVVEVHGVSLAGADPLRRLLRATLAATLRAIAFNQAE